MRTTTAMLTLLTAGTLFTLGVPGALAQITDAIDDPTGDVLSYQHTDPCDSIVDFGCTCTNVTWLCAAGNPCDIHVLLVCVTS
jgi:hypothetical protein